MMYVLSSRLYELELLKESKKFLAPKILFLAITFKVITVLEQGW